MPSVAGLETSRSAGPISSGGGRPNIASRNDWIGLAIWSAAIAVVRLPATVPVSWTYFDQAAAFTFGGVRLHHQVVGLHLYHVRPGDQFGPLSILAAQALRELGGNHVVTVAHLVVLVAGLGVLWLVADAAGRTGTDRLLVSRGAFILAGAIFLFEWDHLALDSLHIDDAIALVGAAVALNAISRGSAWWWAALAIGAATAAKPWAIAFLPMLAVVPHGRRRIAATVAVLIGLGVWAPFVLADSKTLLAARHAIVIEPSSVLRLLGVHAHRNPHWDRLAQLAAAVTLGVAAVARRRWEGVVLVAVAARIMLDPSVHTYYTTGFVFGALAWDVLQPQWRWPVVTLSVASLLELPTILTMWPALAATLRLIAVAAAIAAVLALPLRNKTSRAQRAQGPLAESVYFAGTVSQDRHHASHGIISIVVTRLTKAVDGIRTAVVWERDCGNVVIDSGAHHGSTAYALTSPAARRAYRSPREPVRSRIRHHAVANPQPRGQVKCQLRLIASRLSLRSL